MWVAKLQLRHNDCPIVIRCEQLGLVVYSYPSTWYTKHGKKYATTVCYFQEYDEAKKQTLLSQLKADSRIVNMSVAKNAFTIEVELEHQGQHVMLYHTKEIFFVKPVINHFDGHEYWEVGSWTKAPLQKFIAELKKNMDVCKIIKLKKSALTDVHFPHALPQMSAAQKKALLLAFENGYYNYPRDCTLKYLATLNGLAVSTYQEHLRKAEAKLFNGIIPNMFG